MPAGLFSSPALPAIGKLTTLAVEELCSYLQRKGNNALTKALQLLDQDLQQTRNMMHQLKQDLLLHGEYDVNSTPFILKLLENLDGSTDSLEWWLLCNDRNIAKDMVHTTQKQKKSLEMRSIITKEIGTSPQPVNTREDPESIQ